MRAPVVVAAAVVACASCVGTTGGGLVTFTAYGAGPTDAASPLTFDTQTGFHMTLTTATIHIGAVYLTTTPQNLSSLNTSCIEPGRYIGEVPGGADVNLLSAAPQPFSVQGDGSIDVARSGELWLTGGDINVPNDPTKIITLQGTAARGASSWPFVATVTIGDNRTKPVSDPAQPGLNPLCKRRIVEVSPIQTPVVAGASLLVRVDPRGWFNSVDFSQLEASSTPAACTTGAECGKGHTCRAGACVCTQTSDCMDQGTCYQGVCSTLYDIPDSDDVAKTGAAFFTGILTGVLPSGESAYSFEFEAL